MSNAFTLNLVSKALDFLALRQTLIAHNISNANNSSAGTERLSFEDSLKAMSTTAAASDLQPTLIREEKAPQIDEQLLLSLKTSTQYRALIKGLNMHFALMQIALRGAS